jgi:hypothetical protein
VIDMGGLRVLIIRVLAASAAFALVCHAQPGIAQSASVEPPDRMTFFIGPVDQSSQNVQKATDYAGYYAPYAVLAALTYLDTLPRPGSSATSIVPQIGFDKDTTQLAQTLMQGWRYRFGYLNQKGCLDTGDIACRDQYKQVPWYKRLKIDASGLSLQVWSHAGRGHACSEVGLAFRGTYSFHDAITDASTTWIGSTFFSNEYEQLGRNIDGLIKGITTTIGCYNPGITQIVTLGHSLGGGLAEFAAMANSTTPPRIAKVIAFNESPITRVDLINPDTVDHNLQDMTIDRFTQQGELLTNFEVFRSRKQSEDKACGPLVRSIQVDAVVVDTSGLIDRLPGASVYDAYERHRIVPLAAQLVKWSGGEPQARAVLPGPEPSECRTLYEQPQPRKNNVPPSAPSVSAGRPVYASYGGSGTPTQASELGPIYSYAADQDGLSGQPARLKSHRFTTSPAARGGRRIRTAHS